MSNNHYIYILNNRINIDKTEYYSICNTSCKAGCCEYFKYDDNIDYLPSGIIKLGFRLNIQLKIKILPYSLQYLLIGFCNINIDKLPPNLKFIEYYWDYHLDTQYNNLLNIPCFVNIINFDFLKKSLKHSLNYLMKNHTKLQIIILRNISFELNSEELILNLNKSKIRILSNINQLQYIEYIYEI